MHAQRLGFIVPLRQRAPQVDAVTAQIASVRFIKLGVTRGDTLFIYKLNIGRLKRKPCDTRL